MIGRIWRLSTAACFFLLIAANAVVCADDATSDAATLPTNAESVSLVPREVFIGDEATLTFNASAFDQVVEPGATVALTPVDMPGQLADVTVRSIELSRPAGESSTVTVKARFVPWNTGSLTLPPITWKGVTVAMPTVLVASLVDRTGTVSPDPPRSPLLIPGTTWLLYGTLLVVLVASLAAWFIARRVFALALGDRQTRNMARRRRFLKKQLARLGRLIARMPPVPWYAELSRALRQYLSLLLPEAELSFAALTPVESIHALADAVSGESSESLFAALSRFDRIRFSGVPCEDDRVAELASLSALAERIEADAIGAAIAEGGSGGRL